MTRIYLVSLLLLLAGCHKNYQFHSHLLPVTCTDLEENVEAALCSESFTSADFPCEKWWRLFNDPALEELIEIALMNNPDIASAEARIRLADEQARVRKSILLPQVDFDPNIQWNKVSKFSPLFFPPFKYYTLTTLQLDMRYELDLWCKNRSRFYAELDELRATFADRAEVSLLLSASVANFYIDLQGNFRRYAIANMRLKEREKALKLYDIQANRGLIPFFKYYETESQVAIIKDLIKRIEEAIEIDRHAISALTGNPACIDIKPLMSAPSVTLDAPFPLPCSLPLDLVGRRPDIIAQLWRLEKTGFLIRAAQAEFYPQIDLMFSPALISTHLSKLFQGGAINLIAEIAARLPIIDNGRRQALLGVAREESELAISEFNRLLLQAVEEVSDALSSLRISDERLKILAQSISYAKKQVDLNEKLLERGIANELPLLESLESYLLQQDLEAIAATSKLQAALNLIRSIGGGYDYTCR